MVFYALIKRMEEETMDKFLTAVFALFIGALGIALTIPVVLYKRMTRPKKLSPLPQKEESPHKDNVIDISPQCRQLQMAHSVAYEDHPEDILTHPTR